MGGRRLAVLHPVKVVLTNIAPGESVTCHAVDNPQDPAPRTREVALTREVFIEQDDFAEVPPPLFSCAAFAVPSRRASLHLGPIYRAILKDPRCALS